MSYIGNTVQNQNYVPAIDYFNGNGSTTAFTLSRPVASVAAVQAVINNVPQNPGDAFTVSGSTITFTSAPPSGTNNIYVYYTSPNTQVVQPGQGTVGTTQLADAAVTTAKLSSTTGTGAVALASLPSFTTTIGVGGATPAASGSGITFPATQSASSDANTLDDYEEGTWTPTYVSSGATFTYNVDRNGRYVKIGNTVTVVCYVSTDGVSGRSSAALILGELPFPAINVNGVSPTGYIYSDSWGGTNYPMFGWINPNGSRIYLANQNRNSYGNVTQMTSNDMSTGSGGYNALRISITYITS